MGAVEEGRVGAAEEARVEDAAKNRYEIKGLRRGVNAIQEVRA